MPILRLGNLEAAKIGNYYQYKKPPVGDRCEQLNHKCVKDTPFSATMIGLKKMKTVNNKGTVKINKSSIISTWATFF